MSDALFEVGTETPEATEARAVLAAQKAVARVAASIGGDLDRIEQALRAGGGYAEMKALVNAHESLVEVHRLLRNVTIGEQP